MDCDVSGDLEEGVGWRTTWKSVIIFARNANTSFNIYLWYTSISISAFSRGLEEHLTFKWAFLKFLVHFFRGVITHPASDLSSTCRDNSREAEWPVSKSTYNWFISHLNKSLKFEFSFSLSHWFKYISTYIYV